MDHYCVNIDSVFDPVPGLSGDGSSPSGTMDTMSAQPEMLPQLVPHQVIQVNLVKNCCCTVLRTGLA